MPTKGRDEMGTTGGLMTQNQARQLAKRLSDSTGMAHVAHTVPQGCWGGTERGWAVTGPAIGLDLDLGQASKGPGPSLAAVQAEIRAQLIEDARARLRQAGGCRRSRAVRRRRSLRLSPSGAPPQRASPG